MRLEPLKPRDLKQQTQAATPIEQRELGQSLSLTSVEDPYALTKNMYDLYTAHTLAAAKIRPINREACVLLQGMTKAKRLIEAQDWARALDVSHHPFLPSLLHTKSVMLNPLSKQALHNLNLLPIKAAGAMATIRQKASDFNTLPPVVARNIGNLLIWTIAACGNERDVLRNHAFEVQQLGERGRVEETLLQVAKDMMVFAGLVRYKLAPRVFETLARVGGDVGAY